MSILTAKGILPYDTALLTDWFRRGEAPTRPGAYQIADDPRKGWIFAYWTGSHWRGAWNARNLSPKMWRGLRQARPR